MILTNNEDYNYTSKVKVGKQLRPSLFVLDRTSTAAWMCTVITQTLCSANVARQQTPNMRVVHRFTLLMSDAACGRWSAAVLKSEAMGLHAVIIPYPLVGHSLPAIQLARKLAGYGIKVTFANVFECLAQEHFEILQSYSIRTLNLGLATDPGPGPLPYFKVIESLEGEAEKLLEKLTNENEAAPPTCLISDIFLGWTQKVATKFNLPRYALCASAANYLSTFLYTPILAAQGKVPVESSRAWEIVHDIPGVPSTHLIDLSSTVQAGSQNFEQFCERNAKPALESVGVFINTFYELEPFCVDALQKYPYQSKRLTKGFHPISMLPVGPLLDDAYFRDYSTADTNPDNRAPYIQWLDKQPKSSVLYVSFGSVAVLSMPQIHELALGLEASKQRFLLVIRPPESKDDSESCPLLPKSFKADVEGKGFVQINGWVSQLDVLSHSAVGGFLTHCGWNSSLESICRGQPMLAWPIQADQRLNCRFLVDVSKVALEVHKGMDGVVAMEEVARAVIQLMVGPKREIITNQVRKLREMVLKAVANSGSVQKSLERSVAELKVWRTINSSPT